MAIRFISFEDREPFAVFALNRFLENVDSKPHRKAIKTILRNRKARKMFVAEAWGMYQDDVGEGEGLIGFFQWLLDNQDEIIALIMKLLPLFI